MTKYIITLCLMILFIASCSSTAISISKPNHSPVIESISYAKDALALSDNEIVCQANDPDGDKLSYKWSSDKGNITAMESRAEWIAPDTMGDYTVSLKVSDGQGGEAAETISIRVLNNADGTTTMPITLNMRMPSEDIVSENASVKVGTMTKITCSLENTSNKKISYVWTATGGRFKGKGLDEKEWATVFWTTPAEVKFYSLDVTATDADGNEARGRVLFDVFCCPRN